MHFVVGDTIGLLVAAIVVALAARRLKLPYTVGLVVAGVGLALLHVEEGISLTHDFIYDIVLPPLLFEAAINIHWRELRRDTLPVLVLAIFGTAVAAAVVTGGAIFALGWPISSALLFGTLIAATDPVAVIAMFKDNGVGGRLRLLVESESLFNDGVAAVLFGLALVWFSAGDGRMLSIADGLRGLAITVGGGCAIGLLTGAAAIVIAGRTADRLVESALTAVSAYGSFLLAERVHASGVLATVLAGLVIGNMGLLAEDEGNRISNAGREVILSVWDFVAFIANSIVFLLIGLAVAAIPFRQLGAPTLVVIIALSLIARALTVYPICLLFMRSKTAIPVKIQHILWWGGLRGALGLALALALPPSLPLRSEIQIATFAVVGFSVVFQGLSMPWLLRRLGFIPASQ
jgi:CPA1 family monovalent cation:H+ antiporter